MSTLRSWFGAALVALLAVGCSRSTSGPHGRAATPANAPQALARTPPMGFNDWNAFGCDVSQQLIEETADFLVSSGLREAGYVYVNIDDCWSLRERGPDGRLLPDPSKFPAGIRGVADYVHGRGLRLGIYGDAGTKTCAGFPGSLGHEELDAETWASWGVDYLKYDNCSNQSDGSRADFVRRYTAMRAAIDRTGRPIVYSICEWGQSQPWQWASGVGHLWRTTGDISDDWPSLRSIIAANAPLAPYAGPGHWNDPDMLEIGNGGMTQTEYRTHMSLWSMMAAPLIIGTDLRRAGAETLAILGKRAIIALDQDELGQQAKVVSNTTSQMVLAKPLADGAVAVALYNPTDRVNTIGIAAAEAGLPRAPAYRLRDLWSDTSTQSAGVLVAGVAAHGTAVYHVSALAQPLDLPASVSLGAELGSLIPSLPASTTLTASVHNRGVAAATVLAMEVDAPPGWLVTASDTPVSERLDVGETRTQRWLVQAPADTRAGQYRLTITVRYRTGNREAASAVVTELDARVIAAPPDGVSVLSELSFFRAANALGPIERDRTNGGLPEADGDLISVRGAVYTRGLGTRAPSEVVYFLGGRCSKLSAEVGIDDAVAPRGAASFKVFADDLLAAESGPVGPEDPARTLEANLTGANWLRLVTELGNTSSEAATPTDWAHATLTCGTRDVPTRPERVIFSFESESDGIKLANATAGGSFTRSTAFHTDGTYGLEVTSPADGNWFGRSFPAPLDLSGQSRLAFDIETGDTGTPGELAVEVAPGNSFCHGGRWAWTPPHSKRTLKTTFDAMRCPKGARVDPTRIEGVWVFVKGGSFVIDQVRAE